MLKHELLAQDGGAAIYLHYGLNPDLQKKQTNPFRQNSTNFSITCKNGIYLFRDWVSDDKGDAIRFTELLLGVSRGEAIRIIEGIYGNTSFSNAYSPQIKTAKSELPIVYPTTVQIACLEQQNSNFHRFCFQIGISAEHLKKWNVGTYLNGKTVFGLQNQVGQYLNLKSVFYNEQGKRTTDIYSLKKPKDEFGNPIAQYKFCLFGEHLLDKEKQKTICLVESEKTAVIGSWFYPKYDWLALGSANGLSHEKIQVLFNRQILFLCDADIAGRKNSSINLLQAYELNYDLLDLFPERQDGYDIADYILAHLIDYQQGNSLPLANPDVFQVEGYLSSLLDNPRFCRLIDAPEVKLNFQGNTGAGKTVLATKIAYRWHSQTQRKVIIAFPLNAIAESKHHESRLKDKAIIPYFVAKHFQERYLAETYYEIEHHPVLFSNYDALPKLCKIIGEGNYDLIIDEQHCLNKDFGFRGQKLSEIFRLAQAATKTLLFSADTIVYGFEDYRLIRTITNSPTRQVNCLKVKNQHQILATLIQRIRQSDKKVMALLNSKKQLESAKNILESGGLKVHIIQSDSALAYDEIYQYLMQEKKFPENIDILLCTSVIATGIDIYLDEPIELIYTELRYGFDKVLCNQFFARVRNISQVTYTSLSIQSPYEHIKINPQSLYNRKLQCLQRMAKSLQNEDNQALQSHILETPFAEKLRVFYRDETGKVVVNKLALGYWVSTKLVENGDALDLSNTYTLVEVIDISLQVEVKLAKAEIKDLRLSREAIIYDFFANERIELAQALISYTEDVVLKQQIKDHYPCEYKVLPQHYLAGEGLAEVAESVFVRVFKAKAIGIADNDLQHLIFSIEKRIRTNVAFAHILNSLKISLLNDLPIKELSNLDQVQFQQYQHIRQSLKQAFEKEGRLNNSQIQYLVNQYYTLPLSKNKTTQLAKCFFDLKEKVCTEDEVKVRYYVYVGERNLKQVCQTYQLQIHPIQVHQKALLMQTKQAILLQNRKADIINESRILLCSKEFKDWFYHQYEAWNPEIRLDGLSENELQTYQHEFEQMEILECPF